MIIWAIMLFWVLPMALAINLGHRRRRSGFAYGIFGWLGFLVLVALSPAEEITLANIQRHRKRLGEREYHQLKDRLMLEERRFRECPHCRERMRSDASVCPHCQRDVAGVT